MKGICHKWFRGGHFSPSMPVGDAKYLKVGSLAESDVQAELSDCVARYGALAPRPDVLLMMHFICACVCKFPRSIYHIRGRIFR